MALARALAISPDLLLLDEPLSNLDAKLLETLRFELREILRAVEGRAVAAARACRFGPSTCTCSRGRAITTEFRRRSSASNSSALN